MQNLKRFSVTLLMASVGLLFTAGCSAAAENRTTSAQEVSAADVEMPFAIGERLTYSIRWGVVRAGTAVLEVHPMVDFEGEEVYHFSLTIRTTRFVDAFYKVRDRIDGFARKDLDGSVLYLLKKEEGKNLRDVRVVYDQANGLAQYSNFGDEQEPLEIPSGTLDPLSVVFVLRAHGLEPGTEVNLPISDGRRASEGVGQVKKRERVRVPAGSYQSILVEPDMKDVGGVFDKSGDSPMQIWFSADDKRMPVRISSQVAVGSFRADLVSVEQVPPGETAKLVNILE